MNAFDLSGRTALVTGGGSGLGSQFACALSAAGAAVILAARNKEKLERMAAALKDQGGEVQSVTMDVTNSDSVRQAFEQISSLSTPDIIVNNAGMAAGASLVNIEESTWHQVMDTNLTGALLVAREGVKRLVDRGMPGTIINIASILGYLVQKGNAEYCVSKAALISLTKTMALEWARHKIRVNAIAPGYFYTDLTRDFLDSEFGQRMRNRVPQRRFGQAGELDGALLLLASEASSYMTGSIITVDGGHSLPSVT